jgi:MFS family permease
MNVPDSWQAKLHKKSTLPQWVYPATFSVKVLLRMRIRESISTAKTVPLAEAQPRNANAFAALRHRNFQLYFIGQLVSNAGTWMQIIAQGWLVYQLGHSEVTLGLVSFASAIPSLVTLPWNGVLVDRMPKRTLLILTQTGAMLLAFVLAFLVFTGLVQQWHIVVLAAGLGLVNSFDSPARQAFVVEMVGREDLPNAIALNSLMFNSARVVGPALGGLLLALVGVGWCFTINGISFLAVIASLWAMEVHPGGTRLEAESTWKQFKNGIRQARDQLELGGLILISLIFSVFAISYIPLLPAFVEQVLGQGAAAYGWLTAAFGSGAVIGAIIIANRQRPGWRGQWLVSANIVFPLMLAGFIFNTWVPLSYVLEFFMGAAFMIEYTMINTLLQTGVSDQMRGRIMALYTITFLGFAPFGNLVLGGLAARFGLGPSVAAFAAISLALSLIVFRRIPGMRTLP